MKFKIFFYEKHETVNDKLKPFIEIEAEAATTSGNIITIYDGTIDRGKVKGVFNLDKCFVAESDSFTELK